MNKVEEHSGFGFEAKDWLCPVCATTPAGPVVACNECGCHLLLLVKIRRLHDDYRNQQKTDAANAIYRPKSS
jgi:hypothetical protein